MSVTPPGIKELAEGDQMPVAANGNAVTIAEPGTKSQSRGSSPESNEPPLGAQVATVESPADVPPFDWDDFEARYEKALEDADEREREVLKEAESLSKYFRVWAESAAVHDNERGVKRLRTRQRFVNLSEESLTQKKKHYEEVVRAFESALALLRSS